MRRKRPCRVCGKWFMPSPRVGERQRVCGCASCQRERHWRNCQTWRERNRDYEREGRLRSRLVREPSAETSSVAPRAEVDWSAARDLVGLEVVVILQLMLEVLLRSPRDLVGRQVPGIMEKCVREVETSSQDEIGGESRGN